MLNIYTKLPLPKSLLLHVDGGCQPKNPGGVVTAGWVIYDKETNETLVEESKVIRDGGPEATNNFGEYSSLGLALTYLKTKNGKEILQ